MRKIFPKSSIYHQILRNVQHIQEGYQHIYEHYLAEDVIFLSVGIGSLHQPDLTAPNDIPAVLFKQLLQAHLQSILCRFSLVQNTWSTRITRQEGLKYSARLEQHSRNIIGGCNILTIQLMHTSYANSKEGYILVQTMYLNMLIALLYMLKILWDMLLNSENFLGHIENFMVIAGNFACLIVLLCG